MTPQQTSTSLQDTSLTSSTGSSSADDSGNATQTSFAESTATSCLGLGEGGSLSDSGISDSGSEQELSERERRLAALRRLTRTLESQLVPEANTGGSDDGEAMLAELWRRVEEAEAELRLLQQQCRELIVRTAASVESRAAAAGVRPVIAGNYQVPR